jgi:hypothetical protein
MRHLKYHILLLLLFAFSLVGIAQSDTGRTVKPADNWSRSIKGKWYISGGIGGSTILINIYGFGAGGSQADAVGISQSAVFDGIVDYGMLKWLTVGLGAAYQTATGAPQDAYNTPYTENLSRLNVATRLLLDLPLGRHVDIYTGFRFGVSFWTDVVTPTPPLNSFRPTLGANHVMRYPSVQYLDGVRFYIGPIGLHIEIGLGTPYLVETGLTFRI